MPTPKQLVIAAVAVVLLASAINLTLGFISPADEEDQSVVAMSGNVVTHVSDAGPTEPEADGTVAVVHTSIGSWVVNLASFTDRQEAEELLAALQQKGFRADLLPIPIGPATWYRVRVPGLKSQQEAEAQMQLLAKKFAFDHAWISR